LRPNPEFPTLKQALEWHPDRHAGGETGVTKDEAEARFKLIGEALEILGDTHKRKLYDDGHDKEVIACTHERSPLLLIVGGP
jgi:DnaJ-class molecular chaperone